MGQSSTFLPNRQGKFQFWNENWDSKKTYLKLNLEHFFIKKVINLILKNKSYLNWIFLKNIKNNLNTKNLNKINYNFFCNSLILKKKNFLIKPFLGHFYLFRFNNWFFLNCFWFINKDFEQNKTDIRKKYINKKINIITKNIENF